DTAFVASFVSEPKERRGAPLPAALQMKLGFPYPSAPQIAQKLLYHSHSLFVIEPAAPMTRAVNDFKAHLASGRFIRALQLERLVHRHLRILITMDQKQRRIALVHMKNRTRQSGQFR